jgi:hypothetical protein
VDDKLRLSLIAPRLAALLHHQVGLPSSLDMYKKQLIGSVTHVDREQMQSSTIEGLFPLGTSLLSWREQLHPEVLLRSLDLSIYLRDYPAGTPCK